MGFPVLYRNCVCDVSELSFPIDDYGFLYGVGLFETMGVMDGHPFLLDRHLERLYRGVSGLGITLPMTASVYQVSILSYLSQISLRGGCTGRLNLYVTAGDRVAGQSLGVYGEPLWLAVFRPTSLEPPPASRAVSLAVRELQFLREPLPSFKTLCYMASILEKRRVPDWDDVLLYDAEDRLLETAFATVYFWMKDHIVTPDAPGLLDGVTRSWLMDCQDQLGIQLVQRSVFRSDLLEAEEVFLSQSMQGIVCVDKMEGYAHLTSGHRVNALSKRVWEQLNKENA